jgi:recombination protein RecT
MSTPAISVKNLLSQESVKKRFQEILGKNAAGFTANLAVMVNNNQMLAKCEPLTVVSAAVISASLQLPLDPNLGFAAIVPYGNKAQFQIMYKGLVQLAQRSGQYQTINVSEIYEGELIEENRVTGEYVFDFTQKKSDKVIGYTAYFKMVNGFTKTIYWTRAQVEKHGKQYSQMFARGKGKWVENFDAMAKKTLLKSLISKWGILSIEMQKAVRFDQGVVHDVTEDAEVSYVDNDSETRVEPTVDALGGHEEQKKLDTKQPEEIKTDEPQKNLELR